MVTKVAFVLDGYSTDHWDLIYVEDPLFQDPKLTSKDNKSIVELKVRGLSSINFIQFSVQLKTSKKAEVIYKMVTFG